MMVNYGLVVFLMEQSTSYGSVLNCHCACSRTKKLRQAVQILRKDSGCDRQTDNSEILLHSNI